MWESFEFVLSRGYLSILSRDARQLPKEINESGKGEGSSGDQGWKRERKKVGGKRSIRERLIRPINLRSVRYYAMNYASAG